MGRRPDSEAQDTLNQIEDVITNHYEHGYKYTARELREILDSIVAILDADHAPGAGAASVRQAIEPTPEREDAHSQPVITAVVHSDDRMKSMDFPANRWFAAATDEEIRDLVRIDWGYNLEADHIAYFMEPLNRNVRLVLDYCRELKRISREPIGFEVVVDKDQAMAWLALHRAQLWHELRAIEG